MLRRSLRSVTRPVHGYVCLSCLVQGVEISSRVSRSYCDNAAAIPVKSIPPVPQIVPAVATPLKTKSHGESSDPPAIVLGGNENVYQGVDKEPEKSKSRPHPKPKKGTTPHGNKPRANLDSKGEKTDIPLESEPLGTGKNTSQPQAVASVSGNADVGSPAETVPKGLGTAKKKGRKARRKAAAKKVKKLKAAQLDFERKLQDAAAMEASIEGDKTGGQETSGFSEAVCSEESTGSLTNTCIKSPEPSGDSAQTVQSKSGDQLDNLSKLKRKRIRKVQTDVREALSGQSIVEESLSSKGVTLTPQDMAKPPVPRLSYGLDRVLFNPGVYHLQDPRSRVYNFDPYLASIMPITEFNFAALNEYITSSKDTTLRDIAVKHGKKYVGSSSSMTAVLTQFHFLLSEWRPINANMISQGFPDTLRSFTRVTRSPCAVFLRYKEGVYAIDADKEFDSVNILMNLGKSMEKLLTMPTEDFERYRRSNENKFSEGEGASPEAYHYSTCGDFVLRAQLDAHDPRLPGTGMFDLKTRAVVSIRMDARNFEQGLGYEIKSRFGSFESFEREYFDMIRAAFLKYSLQVRIGRMDGIFVAFHNIERIFGFQYVSLPELDHALHGQYDTTLGDAEFGFSLALWNKIFNKATEMFPERSLRFHFETRDTKKPFMYIFAEPVTDEEIDEIQNRNKDEIEALQKGLLNREPTNTESEAAVDPSDDGLPASEEVSLMAPPSAPLSDGPESQESSLSSDVPDVSEPLSSTAMPATSGGLPTPDSIECDSSASADVEVLDQLETDGDSGETSRRDIFAMTLLIQNKVNGVSVARPENLTCRDKWTIDYELAGFSSADRAWKVYQACQNRRARLLGELDQELGQAANRYQQQLRKLSEKGRTWRKEQDKLDKDIGTVILNG